MQQTAKVRFKLRISQSRKRAEKKQLKTILMDKKLGKTTNLCVEIMNSKRNLVTWYNSRLPFDIHVMLNLSRVTFMANGKGQIQVENSQNRK